MKIFSMNSPGDQVLCDTPVCYTEIRHIHTGETFDGFAHSLTETVLCIVSGSLHIKAEIDGKVSHANLTDMQGAQLPTGSSWSASATSKTVKVLRIDSPHPNHTAAQNLIAPLRSLHTFKIAANQSLVYTDYVRGGVLNFAPRFAADKHYHERADEIFWFFEGTCHITTAKADVLLPAGSIVYTPADEWHIIANDGGSPLLMFLAVTPNVVPSHTFFKPDGTTYARSMEPLTHI